MLEVVDTGINSFACREQSIAFSVQPSDQLITLTYGQLQDLIQEAIERAIVPLEARLAALERGVRCGEGGEAPQDGQKGLDPILQVVQDLQAENRALKRELEAFQEHVAQERAFDRQRIAKLEHQEPQPLQKDRGEILRALIAAHGGKMLAKDARKKMHLSKSRFSELLATQEDHIETKPYHLNRSAKVLLLK